MRVEIGCGLRPACELSTTNPGKSSASLPSPYWIHDPMLGRPLMVVPVFIKVLAGSWLMASVCIDRMTANSSTCFVRWGKSAVISVPLCPYFLKGNCGRKHVSRLFCNCAIDCPFVNSAGIGWPFIFTSSGLFASNVSKCEGPPDI